VKPRNKDKKDKSHEQTRGKNLQIERRDQSQPLGVTAELLAELVPSLPTPKPTRIVVIGCGVKVHFPWDRACRAFDGAVCEGAVGLGADLARLVPGFGAQPLERPFLDLLTDAGQIGRVEAFPAQEFAHGFVAALSFQINLELFLGGQIPPFFVRTLVRFCGWVATNHVSVSVLSHQGPVLAPVALRAPFARTCPSTL
jgi:hypothetical protein